MKNCLDNGTVLNNNAKSNQKTNSFPKSIDFTSEQEKQKILYEFNDTLTEYPKDKTIQEIFEKQAEIIPNNTAIVFKDEKLTYRELNEKANNLAWKLRKDGVKADDIVGIMTEKSIEMIIGILAILKAGGAYLPIDPDYPEERVQYMLRDSKAKILLICGNMQKKFFFEKALNVIKVKNKTVDRDGIENLKNLSTSRNLAYVIYTSGSTGRPKGVMVEHKSVVRLVKNNRFIKLDNGDRILQTGSLAFDASTFEIWGALLNGLELYLEEKEKILNAFELEKAIKKNRITIIWLTVSLFNQLTSENENIFEGLRYLLVGGDVVNPYYVNKVRKKYSDLVIINGYGPTENTTFSTCFTIDKEYKENIPIGKPISNSSVYILGKNNELVSIGVYGELCVAGDGLARGYLNMPELTAEKFIENPFLSGERMYRTGDLARWMPDGNIEFLGRIDNQVKIRGFRIELGEIESKLLKCQEIKEAVVVAKQDGFGNKYICAYFVTNFDKQKKEAEQELTIEKLRNKLQKELPSYMIPSYFIKLDKIPLTPNGKVDKRALPEPDGKISTGIEYEAPRNEVEKIFLRIWSQILSIEKIGIDDDFFMLGGHSLKAMQMISALQKELNVSISIGDIFNNPTIRQLAEYAEGTKKSIYSSIKALDQSELFKVSPAQKRMFALNQLAKEKTNYNILTVMILAGKVEKNKVEETFKMLVNRHESLRTSFELVDGEIMQRIHKSAEFNIEYEEINTSSEETIKKAAEKFIKPFDLSKAPLLRVKLIKLEAEKYILMFDMHHIISDGTSMSIVMEEFSKLYRGEKLEELKLQYKDYSEWINEMQDSDILRRQEEYWLNTFSEEIPVLDLQTDYQRPTLQNFEGERLEFSLNRKLTEKLKKICRTNGATLYMMLLSAYTILLSKYSGQEDIIVGSPIAGRQHPDLQSIVGMFVNTLVMRNFPEGKKKFNEFLQEVKKNALDAYSNQDYQFDILVEKLDIRKDFSRNPLFDTMFVFQNTDNQKIKIDNIQITEYDFRDKVSTFDITLEAEEKQGEIKFDVEYCTKLFNRGTIERLINHYINILGVVADNPEIKLCEIDMLSEKEKKVILLDFNNTKAEYPKDKTMHELFEEQVKRTPQNIAVAYENNKLTYNELNEKANCLAGYLRENGVGPESIVGLILDKSLEMIIAIIGILKAGGAFLPIDSQYPEERIKYMLEDSKARILLTQSSLIEKISALTFDGKIIDVNDEKYYQYSCCNIDNINSVNDLAYVIYTSGSTGRPKGVAINNRGMINSILFMADAFNIQEGERELQFASYSFDASVCEIFTALIKGAELYIPSREVINNTKQMQEYLIKNKITAAIFPPPYLNNLEYDKKMQLKTLITAGSETTSELLDKWKNDVAYVNAYGPTETSICAATWQYSNEGSLRRVPIGRPIDNTNIYIVDKNNKLQPIGIPGELCVSGEGLARGYLNRPELTTEKFVENPFTAGTRMYRTGDLARWLPDGNIEFLGRIDQQVKIRGFRIELGEIENQLLKNESIREAAVLDKQDEQGDKYLCAYIVSEREIAVSELRKSLARVLPDYMIPEYFMRIGEIPLTPNGKINRRALPEPCGKINTGIEYVPPRNETEEKLIEIWNQVLSVEKIGIDDDFLTLGGHSLKAIKIVSIIQKEFGVLISAGEIFSNPTVRQLGEYLGKTKECTYSSIEAVEEKEVYNVSSAQKRLFALNQFSKSETNYNIPIVMIVEGSLQKNKVEEAFSKLVNRHEAFRTSFELKDGEIMQRIHKEVKFRMEYKEINGSQEEIIQSQINKFIKPFDLANAPLLRVKLLKLSEKKYILMLDMHHIISDGTSMSIIMDEFARLYKGESLEEVKVQYKDYSAWENKMIASDVMKKQEEYWIKRFSDEIPVLDLPADYPRPSIQNFEGASLSFSVDKQLAEKLKRVSKANGATLYMTLLSAYYVLLSKYSGQEDIIVGSPIAGRSHADLQNTVGMFVNTLAIRNYPEESKNFSKFLQEVKESALGAYGNQDYQFDRLVEKLDIRRDLSRNPLFDVMFVLQNTDTKEIELDNIKIKQYEYESRISKFDITLEAEEKEEEIEFRIEYCTKLFKRETIERMIRHFTNILEIAADNPEIKLAEIDMLSEEEKKKIVIEFNNTKVEYSKDKTIYELFEKQVEKTPDKIAVIFENSKLTYRELNESANSLAAVLRQKNVKPDTIVGIMAERSLEMIIGIMGILKAGGAYLPIDSEYPEDRIKYMLEDSDAKILLTQKRFLNKAEFKGIVLDLNNKELYKGRTDNLTKVNKANDLAYIIYTSGSTGKPKGAMIEHYSLVNRLNWMQNKYPIGEEDVILQKTPITFDVSVWELFWWSIQGSRLCLLSPEDHKKPEKIIEAINKNKVTTLHFVPSMLDIFLEYIKDENKLYKANTLKKVFASGEALNSKQVRLFNNIFKNLQTELFNLYGPTEATVDVTFFNCPKKEDIDDVPIGKPIDNIRIYIVDKNSKLQPIGIAGELCIAGDGLARGYLNRPELTKTKFIENPFESGERMYRTGDLVRWLPDGNISYLGRIDNQVKIRGFRIELGEIENQLLKNQEIKEAVVLTKQDNQGNKYLCAYISADREITVSELRRNLSQRLPDYMIPAYFIQMESFPLMPNGKINRKALPEPTGEINIGIEYAAPRNEMEEKLVRIWSNVLGVEKVGIDDDFFALGGHSLKAIKMVSIIQKELSVSISVSEVFSNPTVRQLGEYIGKARRSIYSSIKSVEEKEVYNVSSAQKRLFALNQFSKNEVNYNIPSIMIVDGNLEKNKVEDVFRKLIGRHEAFRTSFEIVDDEIIQKIQQEVSFKMEYEEIDRDVEEIIQPEAEKFVRPFDLSEAPLLRVKLIRLNAEKYILMFDMHHIISDGTSMSIIMDEFTRLYKDESLEDVKVQYKDYSAWENEMMDSEVMKRQEEYWLGKLSDEIPVLDLSADYPRPSIQSFEGASLSFSVDKQLAEKLKKLSKANGATLYMTLLSAYYVLLSKYSGQEDIIVGSPIAGRSHADLQSTVGMFVNTLAIRNYPEGIKKFNEFLQEVKESALGAYENQDYQFDRLVEKLDIRRDLSRNALFDTMLVLQNTDVKEVELDNIKIRQYEYESRISKFDITLEAEEKEEKIEFNIEYCTKLFKRETIERMIEHFTKILEIAADNPEIKLAEIDMLSKKEKTELLSDFNDTRVEYPINKTINELFEEQVESVPDEIAVVYEDQRLTYRELNEKANQLARVLRGKGVKADKAVGIMVDRSIEMIVGIMGIIKAGGAYLPISTEYPEDRIKYMLEDSNTNILLTQNCFMDKLKLDGDIVAIDDRHLYQGDKTNLGKVSNSKNLAYIIYTSGSTGRPKGVMIEQRSVINLVTALFKNIYARYDKHLNVAVVAPYVFDASVKQIFPSLLMGHSLYIVPENARRDGEKLLQYYNENSIDLSDGTPMHMEMLLDVIKADSKNNMKLRHFVIGGDTLSKKSVESFIKNYKNCCITNIYGPTECCVDATAYLIEPEKMASINIIPIGKPLANQKIYILNKHMQPVPVGVNGEMYISGEGLARGYINNLKLTKERFIHNPFVPGERMYKTGDLARWLKDGNIEFVGRADYQVKIRGYRIELGEIESQLLKNQEIKEAVVLDKQDSNGNKYLCAYISSDREITVSELRKSLSQRLPDYMIPAYFIQMESFPLTLNGKINRKALPEPTGEINIGIEYAAPRNEMEEKLVKIWSNVLGVEKVGIDDDFFALGGHSLKAIKMLSIIHRELEVSISVSEVFKNPTVRQLGEYIGNSRKSIYSSIKSVGEKEVYRVSSAQKRLFALNQFSESEVNYNIPSIMILDGSLEKSKVEDVFRKLIKRHEAFRTSFEIVKDEIIQKIHEEVSFKMEYEEIDRDVEEVIKPEAETFIRPFDLSEAPLLRVKLIRLNAKKYILMFDMHHIISDGTSMSIIMDEFTRLYKGESLEDVKLQYKDYSAWENEIMDSDIMKKQEEYWLGKLSDEIPVLDLPTDYPRPSIQSFEGASLNFSVDKQLAEKLKKLSKANGATLYMTLLSAYYVLLSKYSGQEDIIVGSPIAGRSHADLQSTVGMFVNTLAIRNYPEGIKKFNEFLQEVKESALGAYENQDYQFDRLVEKLDIRRDLSRNALFDTMFSMHNIDTSEIELDNIKIRQYGYETKISKFDITLEAEEKEEIIKLGIQYCTKLFKRETIERMIEHFTKILEIAADNPEIKLAEIDMLTEEEKKEIIIEFNNTKVEYPKNNTIYELFEKQVERTPNNIAVVFENNELTYRELNEKANQLARALRGKGVKADKVVGIMVDRSIEMIVGIMGILKAGGAYLPISTEYPEDRIKYMLEDSNTDILLTQKCFMDKVEFDGDIVDLEDKSLYQGDRTNLGKVSDSKNLAYIIYTSGSTGRPKGVMIEQRSVINLVAALFKKIYSRYDKHLNVAVVAPYVFDASVKQIFPSLLMGHSLYIVPENARRDGEKLLQYYNENSIDLSDGTPMHMEMMIDVLQSNVLLLSDLNENMKLKHFIIGGDALPKKSVESFLKNYNYKNCCITNIYGPTECCVDTTAYLVEPEKIANMSIIPIGKPLANQKVYILNKHMQPVPVGVNGEMYISGEGLARGYINNLKLTKEKFIDNPFVPSEKMYKTGDLARWLKDGNIEFVGRADYQVKIRGYRIELGEIESQLLKNQEIKEAVVLDKQDSNGNKYLCAYISSDREITVSELRKSLSKRLPDYMIPAYFIQMESFPLTLNGKINRKALPEPTGDINTGIEYAAPRNEMEEKLVEIWSKTLSIEKIGIDDDFFALGGDSFKAIKLVRSISSTLGVMELFENPTIRGLAEHLSKDTASERTMLHEFTKPIDEKNKVVSIICIPYGGGSAISYQPLANSMPKNYSLYAVELPGHDFSCPDEELASIEECAARCFEEIKEKVKGPIVLYGHCLGASLATLLAYKLEAEGIQVDGVLMGGMFPAPRISNGFFKIWDKIFPNKLTNKANRDMMKTIGGLNKDISPDETEFILRNLGHDFEESVKFFTEMYTDKDKPRFKAPITCVVGESDRATEFYQERYKEWEHFSDNVDLKTIKYAGHFFFKYQALELADIIKEKVDLWQGRSKQKNEGKIIEIAGGAVKPKASTRKQVVPSMKLFLIVAIVQIISEIGTILSTFGTGIWVYKQTGVLSQFAMMLLLGVIPTIVMLPFSGAIVDRFDRRIILIASDILSSVCSFSLLLLLCNNSLHIWQIYIFTVIASIATTFRQPAYMAAITQIAPKIYLTQANSVAQFSVAIGGILASICGGVFMESIGFKGLVAIDFATFIISMVTLIFIRFPDTMFARLEEPVLKQLAGGWNFIIKRKSFIVMIIFFIVTNFMLSSFDVILTPLILSFTNPSVLGVINAFSGLGVLIGSIAMLMTGGTEKRAKGMVGFVILTAVSMMITSIRPLPAFAAIALLGVALSSTIVNIHWQSLIQVKVGLELQGRVFAINQMMASALRPVSYITAAIVADRYFEPLMGYRIFNTPFFNAIVGVGAGRAMRFTVLAAGAILLIWSIMGFKYKPLSEMDDILEDAVPDVIIIKDKDKLQEMADRKMEVASDSENLSM